MDKEPELDYPKPPKWDGKMDDSINELLNNTEKRKRECKGCRFKVFFELQRSILTKISMELKRFSPTESGKYYTEKIKELNKVKK